MYVFPFQSKTTHRPCSNISSPTFVPVFGSWWLNATMDLKKGPSQYLHCEGGFQNALTHSDAAEWRRDAEALWQAPSDFTGKVRFRATIVEEYKTFWTDVVSPVVRITVPQSPTSRGSRSQDTLGEEGDDDDVRLTRKPRQKRPAGDDGDDADEDELPHQRLKVAGGFGGIQRGGAAMNANGCHALLMMLFAAVAVLRM